MGILGRYLLKWQLFSYLFMSVGKSEKWAPSLLLCDMAQRLV